MHKITKGKPVTEEELWASSVNKQVKVSMWLLYGVKNRKCFYMYVEFESSFLITYVDHETSGKMKE